MSWLFRKGKGDTQRPEERGSSVTLNIFMKKIRDKIKKFAKAGLQSINTGLSTLGKKLELGFITIIKTNTYVKDEHYGKVYFVFLFGKQIYPQKKNQRTNGWVDANQPVLYFKINRMSDYAKPCIQHWVNIAYHMKADYYFICDNIQLQYHLLRTVNFPGSDIKFMTSRQRKLRSVVKGLSSPRWENATYAHITPFVHAKSHNLLKFWCIDADDTMICLKESRTAMALKQAEKIADKQNFAAFSLDMWRSRTFGRYWTWGIVYISGCVDFWNLITENTNLNWFEPYAHLDTAITFDWFFTYLKDTRKADIETFYIDNTYFIHWGDFIRHPQGAHIIYWGNGNIVFPILKHIFLNSQLGQFNIADCHKLSVDATDEESLFFVQNEVTDAKFMPKELRELLHFWEFSPIEKSKEKL